MERYCSTGQSPQRAVAPTEEEEEEEEEELHLSGQDGVCCEQTLTAQLSSLVHF